MWTVRRRQVATCINVLDAPESHFVCLCDCVWRQDDAYTKKDEALMKRVEV